MQRFQLPFKIKRLTALLALAAMGLLTGCFGGGNQTTIMPASEQADTIQSVYKLVTYIDVGILILVTGLFFYAIIRYRAKKGQEDQVPEQAHGNPMLEVLWTLIPAILLIFIAVPTWKGIFKANNRPPGNTLQIEAIGHQWWWEFRYTGLGAVAGQDLVTANEFYMPLGKTVVIDTSSKDVIHAFWLPRLVGKIDSMPDRKNFLWFTPREKGIYYGQCAEFCGTSHANMRFRAKVVSQSEFDAWVARLKQPPLPTTDSARAGEKLFIAKGCIACHSISGVPVAASTIGPNLTSLSDRSTLASAILKNTPENLVRWILHTQEVKPGALMGLPDEKTGKYSPIPMTDAEAGHIAAYLLSKPGQKDATAMAAKPDPKTTAATTADAAKPAAVSITGGDAAAGKALITTKGCIGCHIVAGIPGAVGKVGPTLDKFAGRPKISGVVDNTPENLAKWLQNPPAVKKGTLMPPLGLNPTEIANLIKFLGTLK